MKKILLFFCLMFFLFSISSARGENAVSAEEREEGRYKLYEMTIDNKAVQFLLDSKTGKVWVYQLDGASGKKSFTGITVEGVVVSKKETDSLNAIVDQWQADGIVDKSVQGVKNRIIEEFSYYLDSKKAKQISEEQKTRTQR